MAHIDTRGRVRQPGEFLLRNPAVLERALTIRMVEERLLRMYSEGALTGTVHTCVGQELSALAVITHLETHDSVFSTHRGHGHFLSHTGDVEGLVAEVMGRDAGVCRGVGGTQHLRADEYWSNGIQGGMMPVAAGRALAHALDADHRVTAVFIGDGTLGEGAVYETLNLASVWSLPLLVVVENNHYAQSTRTASTTSGSIASRAAAFDIDYRRASTWDPEELFEVAGDAVRNVRSGLRPTILEIETDRLMPHSKGDDNRDPTEIASYWERDAISHAMRTLSDVARRELTERIERRLDAAVATAADSPMCQYEHAGTKFADPVTWAPITDTRPAPRYVDLVHDALAGLLETHPGAMILGEDIEAPYGGAFKVTRDLSVRYPGRVLNTPISEAAITGIGSGLALGRHLAVIEVMFGDFLTLCFDQLLQHASKFTAMYGVSVPLPLVVRTPMGGRRGYGPTHSQSIEKHFCGIDGLTVVAVNQRMGPAEVLARMAAGTGPFLLIENKVLYTRQFNPRPPVGYKALASDETFSTVRITPVAGRPQVTVFCYGGVLEEVEAALEIAFDEGDVLCDVISPTCISPLSIGPLREALAVTGTLLTVEEGCAVGGVAGEAIARLVEQGVALRRVRRLSHDGIVPASSAAEADVLPSRQSIADAILALASA